MGNWCIMAGGSWGKASGDLYSGRHLSLPNPFLKWYQHWLTPVQLSAPQTGVALPNSAQNPVAYLLGANPGGIDWDFGNASGTGEYFLVENRQQVGFDAGLWKISSSAKGCMIWHVDETRTYTNTPTPTRRASWWTWKRPTAHPRTWTCPAAENSGDAGDPWPGSTGETAFGAASDPNSNWYDGSASGIAVTNISTAGTGCTVDFSGLGPAWDGSDSTLWSTPANWTVGRVPTQNDVTLIPSGVPNWPNVDAAASVFNLNILNGAHLNATAGVSLDVYGDWTRTGQRLLRRRRRHSGLPGEL